MNARVFERMDFEKKSQIFDDDDDDFDAPQKGPRGERRKRERERSVVAVVVVGVLVALFVVVVVVVVGEQKTHRSMERKVQCVVVSKERGGIIEKRF